MRGIVLNQYQPNPSKFDRFRSTFSFFFEKLKKMAQKLNIFQLFPSAPAPRHPETLPPSKSSRWRCRTTNFHPDWTKWRPSYAHLKFQNLTFFINLRSLPPLPSQISPWEEWETPFTSCFCTDLILPMEPFDDIGWEQGQKAGRHLGGGSISQDFYANKQ